MIGYHEGSGITEKQLKNIFDKYYVLGLGYVPHENHAAKCFTIYPPRIPNFKGHESKLLCLVANVDLDHPHLGIHLQAGHAYVTQEFIENDPNLESHLKALDKLVGPNNVHVYDNNRVFSANTIDIENKMSILPAFAPNLGRD